MENVRDRTNLEFIPHTNIDQIIKRQSKLSFKGITNHYSEFSVYKFDKEKVIFDKPIYLGFSVLELSKLLMYEFYYHKLQPYYNNKIKLHYMDTDSFILRIKTGDLINDLEYFKDDFEVIGKMKIETSSIIELDNFVALRSKSYSFSYGSAQKLTQEAKQRTIQKSKQKGIQHTPIYCCNSFILDSFILRIKTGDLINDLEYFKDDFEVIGKMKIETSSIIELDNFVALRSKS